MKIIDEIKEKGRPYKIPNAFRNDLPTFFTEMGYKVGVEIGTLRGEFAEEICKAGLKLFAVDPYQYYKGYRRHPKEAPMEEIYQEAKTRLAPYDCTFVRKTSMDALDDFEDNSLDFVYIDGNHNVRYVIEDIYEWYRKIRPGGTISGHDYEMWRKNAYGLGVCHVEKAVHLMVDIYNVEYYVLGQNYGLRDKHRSWLWIKA